MMPPPAARRAYVATADASCAVSRVSGWTAHILEQYAHNRLIRPRAEYIGPAYPQTYIPLDRR